LQDCGAACDDAAGGQADASDDRQGHSFAGATTPGPGSPHRAVDRVGRPSSADLPNVRVPPENHSVTIVAVMRKLLNAPNQLSKQLDFDLP
jgi:hypothetical protein